MKKAYLIVLLISTVAFACQSNKVPKDAKIVERIVKEAPKSDSFKLANFTLSISELWEQEDASNSMRVTQFKLKEHPEYQVVVSFFGNNDKMVKANIERWRKQFSLEESYANLELANKDLTAVKILGTFKLKSFPMAQDFTETPDYGTLAAIIPSSEGPYFFKLTAPKDIIESQVKTFIDVLNSHQEIK